MLAELKVALTAAIIFSTASAALANDSGPPNIDIQKTCRESSDALNGLIGNETDTFGTCMSDEQAAREQLVKDWATYPALAKAQCVKPKEFLPGYVEWQSCIEMTRDVMKMRQEQAVSTKGSSTTAPHGNPAYSSGLEARQPRPAAGLN
jgi:hypothetical protein